MIVRLFYKTRKDGVNLYRTYSDLGQTIIKQQTGTEYDEAIDVENAPYTYIESGRTLEEKHAEMQAKREKTYENLNNI